jgi:protein-disulfide isomerase
MDLVTLLLVLGIFFGIVPNVDDCTLDADDCAIIEESGDNMRRLSALTVNDVVINLAVDSENEDLAEEITVTGNGQMGWDDGQVEMEMQLTFSQTDGIQEQLHFIFKDGTAYSYDSVFEQWEQTPFNLDARTVPTLTIPEAEWSGENGEYILTINTPSFFNSDAYIAMNAMLLSSLAGDQDLEEVTTGLRDFYQEMSATDLPYTVTYMIEDGFITGVVADGSFSFPIISEDATIVYSMTLELSNHNQDVTIEAPEIETSRSLDEAQFSAYAGIPVAGEGIRDVTQADDVVDGVVRGVTDAGYPFIGSPDAPVTIAEFSDFSCPHCTDYLPEMERMIGEFVRSGQLRVIYVPMTFVGEELSVTAARGALCAADQGAFWEYHHTLFDIQQAEGSAAFTVGRMYSLAAGFGLDEAVFQTCMASQDGADVLRVADELRTDMDVDGTPTLIFRLGDDEWRRFLGEDDEPLARLSYEDISELITNNQ